MLKAFFYLSVGKRNKKWFYSRLSDMTTIDKIRHFVCTLHSCRHSLELFLKSGQWSTMQQGVRTSNVNPNITHTHIYMQKFVIHVCHPFHLMHPFVLTFFIGLSFLQFFGLIFVDPKIDYLFNLRVAYDVIHKWFLAKHWVTNYYVQHMVEKCWCT
jgi:hypothetical protein